MAKKFDPKAKARRQKIMVAVGGVILLGLLAFQLPRTMRMLNQHAPESAAATTTSPETAATPAATAAASPASATVAGNALADPDALPEPQSGQLLAFSRFRTKDPFAQQLELACASTGSSPGASASSSCGADSQAPTPAAPRSRHAVSKTGSATTPPQAGVAVQPVAAAAAAPPAELAKPTSATISVNGVSERVHIGADFPASSPTFTLVSLTRSSAKLGIAGGSLEGGSPTVTLGKGKPLTLMNTADGTRYVLRLLSVA